MRIKPLHSLFLLLMCAAALACRSSPVPHYYLLSSDLAEPSAPRTEDVVVGIGPIEFPMYLNRPQLVVRRDSVEVELLEMHRWAEPLDQSFATALAEQVAVRTGWDRVLVFPWSAAEDIGRRVKAKVSRFDVDETGRAVLVVHWQVQSGDGEVLVPSRRSKFAATATSGEPTAMVEALAAVVAAFSEEIAAFLGG